MARSLGALTPQGLDKPLEIPFNGSEVGQQLPQLPGTGCASHFATADNDSNDHMIAIHGQPLCAMQAYALGLRRDQDAWLACHGNLYVG